MRRYMIYSLAMPFFTTHTIILLPHARHHLERRGIPLAEVLETLNNPERKEGLATDMFTVERAFPSYTLYVDYYLIRPLVSCRLFPSSVQVRSVFTPPSSATLFLYRRPSIAVMFLPWQT